MNTKTIMDKIHEALSCQTIILVVSFPVLIAALFLIAARLGQIAQALQ